MHALTLSEPRVAEDNAGSNVVPTPTLGGGFTPQTSDQVDDDRPLGHGQGYEVRPARCLSVLGRDLGSREIIANLQMLLSPVWARISSVAHFRLDHGGHESYF